MTNNDQLKVEVFRTWDDLNARSKNETIEESEYSSLGSKIIEYISIGGETDVALSKIQDFIVNDDGLSKRDIEKSLNHPEKLAKELLKLNLKDRIFVSVNAVDKEMTAAISFVIDQLGGDIFDPEKSPYSNLNTMEPKPNNPEFFKYKVMNAISLNGPVWDFDNSSIKYVTGGAGQPDFSLYNFRDGLCHQMAATAVTYKNPTDLSFETDQIFRHFGIEQLFFIDNKSYVVDRDSLIRGSKSPSEIKNSDKNIEDLKKNWKRRQMERDDVNRKTAKSVGSLREYNSRGGQRALIDDRWNELEGSELGTMTYYPGLSTKFKDTIKEIAQLLNMGDGDFMTLCDYITLTTKKQSIAGNLTKTKLDKLSENFKLESGRKAFSVTDIKHKFEHLIKNNSSLISKDILSNNEPSDPNNASKAIKKMLNSSDSQGVQAVILFLLSYNVNGGDLNLSNIKPSYLDHVDDSFKELITRLNKTDVLLKTKVELSEYKPEVISEAIEEGEIDVEDYLEYCKKNKVEPLIDTNPKKKDYLKMMQDATNQADANRKKTGVFSGLKKYLKGKLNSSPDGK